MVVQFGGQLAQHVVDAPVNVVEGRGVSGILLGHLLPEKVMQAVGLHDVQVQIVPLLMVHQVKQGSDAGIQGRVDLLQGLIFGLAGLPGIGVHDVAQRLEGGQIRGRVHGLFQGRAQKATDQDAIHGAGRIGHRHVDDDHPFSGVAEHFPQCFGLHMARGGDELLVGGWFSLDEAIDIVLARVDPGHHAAPGHRRNPGPHRIHAQETALLGQTGRVGSPPLGNQALHKGIGGAVQADKDQPGGGFLCAQLVQEAHGLNPLL